jgi:hypothetical protein
MYWSRRCSTTSMVFQICQTFFLKEMVTKSLNQCVFFEIHFFGLKSSFLLFVQTLLFF